MKKIAFIAACVLTFASFTSCSQGDNPVKVREAAVTKLLKKEHRIKIAIAGPWAQNRDGLLNGFTLACDEVNAAGGVLGAQIELLPFDDNYTLDTGGRVAYQIASDNQICAVIGHVASAISISNSLIYHYYGILQFSPLSTTNVLTQQGFPYVLRNIPADRAFAERAAQFCIRQGWNRIMVYHVNSTYGAELSDTFELYCNEGGIIVPDRVSYENSYGVRDYSEVVKKWKEGYHFDAVFVAGILPQVGEIVSVFRASGLTEPIIGSVEFDEEKFFSIADNKAETDTYCVSLFNENEQNEAFLRFRKAFIDRYGHDVDYEALQGYDALKVLASAIEKAGSVKACDIAQALHAEEVWDEGSGPYRFDKNGDIQDRKLVIKKSIDGVFKVIE
ncbi:MAG: ABC transporter substrate-binding protein [Treponema sp.]|nr:ABC transporter substrate-binding protein [Treponema sp.]